MPNHVWSANELEFIRQNANVLKDIEIARKLTAITGRKVTLDAVRKKRQLLGVHKRQGRGKCEVSCRKPKDTE